MNRSLILLTALVTSAIAAAAQTTTALPDEPRPAQIAASPLLAASGPIGDLSPRLPQTESWTKLSLDNSGLPNDAPRATLLGRYEQPEFTREVLRVQWRLQDPIDLYVVLPHGVAKPPVILYLYDYRFDTDRFRNDGWCKRATQGGFAAVGFVSALSGQRFHSPRPMKEWFVSELEEALATSTHDVQLILNYLASRADVDIGRVGMFGEGSGGAIAVLAAAADLRIMALDVLNPWGDWPDWLKDSPQIPANERAAYLKPKFLKDLTNLDPVLYLPQLKLKSLRVQQIIDDTVTPDSAKNKIAAAVPRPEDLARYKDAQAHMNAWRVSGLNGWLRAQLQLPAETAGKQQPK